MFRKVTSTFQIFSIVSDELYDSYTKAVINLRTLEKTIEAEFLASPEGKILRATSTGIAQKIRFDFGSYPMLNVEHYANYADTTGPSRVIDLPLLNTLLHTKLLTDEEKRSLLEEQGILKPKEVTPTPEC